MFTKDRPGVQPPEAPYRVVNRVLGLGLVLVLTSSGWRVNVRGGPDVEVTPRARRSPAAGSWSRRLVSIA